MVRQLGFLFDVNRCIGCKACELACKSENKTPQGVKWRRVNSNSPESFLSISCNHCDSPECFRVCPNHAFSKRKDGIVEIDNHRCDGCQTCVNACPFHAPQFDPETHKVSKCNLCTERLDQDMIPACVAACHTGALKITDLSEEPLMDTVETVPGFGDIHLTRPSILFRPLKERKRFFNKKN